MKVIVVDDEPWMLTLFSEISSQIPEMTLSGRFRYPEAALEFVLKNEVDIVFLDLMMPKMTGVELSEKIQSKCPNVKIVLITASDEFYESALRDSVADAYLRKPYNVDELSLAAKQALQSHRGRIA